MSRRRLPSPSGIVARAVTVVCSNGHRRIIIARARVFDDGSLDYDETLGERSNFIDVNRIAFDDSGSLHGLEPHLTKPFRCRICGFDKPMTHEHADREFVRLAGEGVKSIELVDLAATV